MIHTIYNKKINYEINDSTKSIILGAGCFWGVEKKFWVLPGVTMTSVGYAGGETKDPSYELVCGGNTGHAEVMKLEYKPKEISLIKILKVFWECHDPTQGMRQGNDIGSQYRSVCYCENNEDLIIADTSLEKYQKVLLDAGLGKITTEIKIISNNQKEEITGIFKGINKEGSMILQTSDGLKLINSGECSIKGIY